MIDLTIMLDQIFNDNQTSNAVKLIIYELVNLKKTVKQQNKKIAVLTAKNKRLENKINIHNVEILRERCNEIELNNNTEFTAIKNKVELFKKQYDNVKTKHNGLVDETTKHLVILTKKYNKIENKLNEHAKNDPQQYENKVELFNKRCDVLENKHNEMVDTVEKYANRVINHKHGVAVKLAKLEEQHDKSALIMVAIREQNDHNKNNILKIATKIDLIDKQHEYNINEMDKIATSVNTIREQCSEIGNKIDETTTNIVENIKNKHQEIATQVNNIEKQCNENKDKINNVEILTNKNIPLQQFNDMTNHVMARLALCDPSYKYTGLFMMFNHIGKYLVNNEIYKFGEVKKNITTLETKLTSNKEIILFASSTDNTTFVIHKKDDKINAIICENDHQLSCKLIKKLNYDFKMDGYPVLPCYQFENDLQIVIHGTNEMWIYKNDESLAINSSSSYDKIRPVFAIEFEQA